MNIFRAHRESEFFKKKFRNKVRNPKFQQKKVIGDPLITVYGRHGQSIGNLVMKYLKSDTLNKCPKKILKDVQSLHGSRYKLTELGERHAYAMNEWFKQCFPFDFDYVYGSTHKRAEQTAYLSLHSQLENGMSLRRIKFRPWRTERNWGIFEKFNPKLLDHYMEFRTQLKRDPLHLAPEQGENLMTLANRAVYPLQRLLRERHSKQVIYCPGHGEVNWMERFVNEHMSEDRFIELEESKDPRDQIHNGSLLIYTCLDPETGEVSDYYSHWCMVVPWEPKYDMPWTRIDRHLATKTILDRTASYTQIPKESIYVPR